MPKPAAKKKSELAAKSGGMTGFVERAKPRTATPTAKRILIAKRPAKAAPEAVRAVRGRPKVFDERRQLLTRIEPEVYHRLRQLSLDTNTSAQDLVIAGLALLFEKHGLEPI